jgi:DNA (cytosine-5)-methyltransferase 1
MRKLNAVSLFSGCGGFDLGIKECGVNIVWANDIDYHAASAYKTLFPDVDFNLKDIREITSFPNADILIGCYPCTGFSQAAKRKWRNRNERDLFKNPNNFLFKEFLRAIKAIKPKFIFVENVQGMLSASNGYFLKEQIDGLKSLGFEDVQLKLLNAENFGLAQSRKRVFIIGKHRSLSDFNYSFPDNTHGSGTDNRIKTLKDIIGHMPEWPIGEFSETKFHGHYLTRNRKRRWDQPSFTVVASSSHIPLHPIGEPMIKVGKDKWKLQGKHNRRLSWRECALIQGLPEHINIDGNLNAKYKVIGNSVPPPLAKAIASPVVKFLSS